MISQNTLEIVSFFGFNTKGKLLVVVCPKGIKLPGIKNPDNIKPQLILDDKFQLKKNNLTLDGLLVESIDTTGEGEKQQHIHAKAYLLKGKISSDFAFRNKKLLGSNECFEEMTLEELIKDKRTLPLVLNSIKEFQKKERNSSLLTEKINSINQEIFEEAPVPTAVSA